MFSPPHQIRGAHAELQKSHRHKKVPIHFEMSSDAKDSTTLPAQPAGEATKPAVKETPAAAKSEAKETPAAGTKDDDLDDLDDLLDDFADDILAKPPGSSVAGTDTAKSAQEPLNDEFKNGIEELIKDLKIEDPETQLQFADLVKQFELNHREEAETEAKKPHNFEYVMKETMERLKKGGESVDEKIKNDASGSNPEDMLTQLLSQFGGAGEGGDMDMSNLLVDMLEQLLSKEVLYEPIKDLNDKFPPYLKEKKDTLSEHDFKNYTKQYEITNDILAIFDAPDYSDENKVKRDEVNSLLESLQEMGQPPNELIGDAGDFPLFGGGGAGEGLDGLDFDGKDLPAGMDKQLEESCKQQ